MSSVSPRVTRRVKSGKPSRAADGPKHAGKHLDNWRLAGFNLSICSLRQTLSAEFPIRQIIIADRSVARKIDVCVTLFDQPVALGVAAPERASVNGSGRRLLEEASEHGNAETAGPEHQVLSFAPDGLAARSSRAMSGHRLKRLTGLQESRNGGGCASKKCSKSAKNRPNPTRNYPPVPEPAWRGNFTDFASMHKYRLHSMRYGARKSKYNCCPATR